jgi:hypothetical protein
MLSVCRLIVCVSVHAFPKIISEHISGPIFYEIQLQDHAIEGNPDTIPSNPVALPFQMADV